MKNRDAALLKIYNRIKSKRVELALKTFKQTPTEAIVQADLPCVFLHEDLDVIISHSKRTATGYPAKRVLEIVIELVTDKNTDIKALYRNVRSTIFTVEDSDPPVYDPKLTSESFITENRTEGPTGYGLPDVLGMRLVLDLVYTDDGL